MPSSTRSIFLDPNVLLQYIYDSNSLVDEDYWIIKDDLEGSYFWTQSPETSGLPTENLNVPIRTMFPINSKSGIWNAYSSTLSQIQVFSFDAGQPIPYDTIKICFPLGFNFGDYKGFQIDIWVPEYDESGKVYFSSFYYDKSNILHSNPELISPPLLISEKLWGTQFIISFPSIGTVKNQRDFSLNVPITGSINYAITGSGKGNGISQTSPVMIDFKWIRESKITAGVERFYENNPFQTAVPSSPLHSSIGVKIESSSAGDFFEINGTYNGSVEDFSKWVDEQEIGGARIHVQYEIQVFEENFLFQSPVFYSQFQNFSEPIKYRPILLNTTTTGNLVVNMQIINSSDGSILHRTGGLGLLQNEIGKYGPELLGINVKGIFKPIIWNKKPDVIQYQSPGIEESGSLGTIIEYIPQLYEKFNISVSSRDEITGELDYIPNGKMRLILQPFDNIFQLNLVQSQSKDTSPKTFSTPPGSIIILVFKSDKRSLEIPLYFESEELDSANGNFVFKITEKESKIAREIWTTGFDNFYITLQGTNGSKTVLYSGKFAPFESGIAPNSGRI